MLPCSCKPSHTPFSITLHAGVISAAAAVDGGSGSVSSGGGDDNEEWSQVVGKKNKSAITRGREDLGMGSHDVDDCCCMVCRPWWQHPHIGCMYGI